MNFLYSDEWIDPKVLQTLHVFYIYFWSSLYIGFMIYERRPPSPGLEKLINCYWLIDSEGDSSIEQQKIVPDGYPEIILHYRDVYRIKLGESWETQGRHLLAGQIKKHFYLENTGHSGMLGIKLQPTALAHLFGLSMDELTDSVIKLPNQIDALFTDFALRGNQVPESLFSELDQLFGTLGSYDDKPVDLAVRAIIEEKGNITIQSLCELANCSERQLERQFKTYVGLSPKFYTRIIRLGHIFELMQQDDQSWSDLVYSSGFYDQSHFIKNFKEFTGEDPSAYGFEVENMANFHLRK